MCKIQSYERHHRNARFFFDARTFPANFWRTPQERPLTFRELIIIELMEWTCFIKYKIHFTSCTILAT